MKRFWLGMFTLGFVRLIEAQTNETDMPVTATTNRWVRGHDTISKYVTSAGDHLDRWLAAAFEDDEHPRSATLDHFYGDRRVEEEAQTTRLQLSPRVEFREGQGVQYNIKFNVKLKLPRLEDRVQIVIDNLREDEEVIDELQTTVQPAQDLVNEPNGSASLRVLLKETMHYRATFDSGAKFNPLPVPRFKLRLRMHHPMKKWTPRFTQSFFWEGDDGFGEKTQFDMDRGCAGHNLFRLTTSVLWSETSHGVEVGEIANYYYFISERRALAIRAGVIGHVEPESQVDTYIVRFPYRQKIYRNWLYLEIEPGVDFPIDRNYDATPLIQIRFEILFGKLPEEETSKN